jgi:hypothetical protein
LLPWFLLHQVVLQLWPLWLFPFMLSQVLAPSHVPKLEMPNMFCLLNCIYPACVISYIQMFARSPLLINAAGSISTELFS